MCDLFPPFFHRQGRDGRLHLPVLPFQRHFPAHCTRSRGACCTALLLPSCRRPCRDRCITALYFACRQTYIIAVKTYNLPAACIARQARDDRTANGLCACREGKCSRECCNSFNSKTKHESSIAKWIRKSRSPACVGHQTATTRRRPCCLRRKQTHARQATGNQLHASGRAG